MVEDGSELHTGQLQLAGRIGQMAGVRDSMESAPVQVQYIQYSTVQYFECITTVGGRMRVICCLSRRPLACRRCKRNNQITSPERGTCRRCVRGHAWFHGSYAMVLGAD